MEIEKALRRLGGAGKTWQLRELGVGESAIRQAITQERVIRLRKGWFALSTISPLERRAGIDHGFLTCSTAAVVRGLPAKSASHYHLRAIRPVRDVRSGRRRTKMQTLGVLVSNVDMVEDYLRCQSQEWSLALVDQLARNGHLPASDWREIERRLPKELRKLAQSRSAVPESPLESVVRYRLARARVPFEMQKSIGKFRVDFLIAHGVVLETHGAEFHSGHETFERDRARTIWLREMGFDVIEMSYRQLDDWERVLKVIERARRRNFTRVEIERRI